MKGAVVSIQRGFSQNAFNDLLTLRLITLFPFFLVNLAAGLTLGRLSTYVVASARWECCPAALCTPMPAVNWGPSSR